MMSLFSEDKNCYLAVYNMHENSPQKKKKMHENQNLPYLIPILIIAPPHLAKGGQLSSDNSQFILPYFPFHL